MISKYLIAFALLFWTPTAVLAQESPAGFWKDGNQLLAICKDGLEAERHVGPDQHQSEFAWGLCAGFIDGVRHGIWFSTRVRTVVDGVRERPLFCVSDEATIHNPRDRMETIVRHLEQNPQSLDMPPAFLVAEALTKAFPCQ